jgi:hypothetical protein
MIPLKKLLAIITAVILVLSSLPALAENALELNTLAYEEYMRGESIFVSGTSNVYVTVGLYYPEEVGGTSKYVKILSPDEFYEGIEIQTDTDSNLWPDGTWKIIAQAGDLRDEITFELSETVDRTEEEPTEAPTKKPSSSSSSSSSSQTVTLIELDPSSVTIAVGEDETVSINSTASSFTVEVDDKNIASASISGKKLTVKGLKKGTTSIYVRTSSNYASLKVNVTASVETPTESATEESTEPTEITTEPEVEEPTSAPAAKFDDISGHWAESDILSLYSLGIISGMSETKFMPEEKVTRAQFVTMLKNAFDLKAENTDEVFNDVKKSDWYFEAVNAAYECGIAKGTLDGSFNPNALVTRQDMALFAYRAASFAGFSFNEILPTIFDDDYKISDYAKNAVYSMKAEGVINGMTDTTFEPLANATRAQAAKIIAALYSAVE